jgi:hypothetical protein
MALRHVLSGRRIVIAQRERVSRLLAQGKDTTQSEQLLSQYERVQAIFEEDLKRLSSEAAQLAFPPRHSDRDHCLGLGR